MFLSDSVTISGARKTRDGYLVADARVARTGIQIYTGAETGRPDLKEVRVYRPESEVFARDTMASVAYRPLTDDHPSEMVDSTNWRNLSRGNTGGEVIRDGEHVRVPLVIMDAAAIASVEGGKRELSLGYTCDLEFTPGTTPGGEAFDAVQRNIKVNHLALCSSARAGRECRIGDGENEQTQTPTLDKGGPAVTLRTIILDGLPVETTDAGAAAVDKLKAMLADAGNSLTTATAAHVAAIAAKDAELGAMAAQLADALSKVVTGAALDALAAERSAVVTKAKALGLADAVIVGLDNPGIRRAAVSAKLGDAAAKDKPDAYVEGLFDHLTAGTKAADPVAGIILDAVNVGDAQAKAEAARAANTARLRDAWAQPAGKA